MRDDRETFRRLVQTAHPVHPERLNSLRRSFTARNRARVLPLVAGALVTILVVLSATMLLIRADRPSSAPPVVAGRTPTVHIAVADGQGATQTPQQVATAAPTAESQNATPTPTVATQPRTQVTVSREAAIASARSESAAYGEENPVLVEATLAPYAAQVESLNTQEGEGVIPDDAMSWLIRMRGTFKAPRHGALVNPKPTTGEMHVLLDAASGKVISTGYGPISDGYPVTPEPTPTKPEPDDKTVRLGDTEVILEPSAGTAKISKEDAIEIARGQLGNYTLLDNPHAKHWLATNPAEKDPNSPTYMQKLPVWVVTFDTVKFGRTGREPSDIPPNPEPMKIRGQAQVMINSNTGEHILTEDKSEVVLEGSPTPEPTAPPPPEPTTSPAPDAMLVLSQYGIILEPAPEAPKITADEAKETAHQYLSKIQTLTDLRATHWLATNTRQADPKHPEYMRRLPVWVVSFRTLAPVRGEPNDVPPAPRPPKFADTRHVLVDSTTGETKLVVGGGPGTAPDI